jgi:hypothetical protein
MVCAFNGLKRKAVLLSLGVSLGIVSVPGWVHAGTIVPTDMATLSGETLSTVAGFPALSNVPVENLITGATIATLSNVVLLDTGVNDADYGNYVYEETLTTLSPMGGAFSSLTTQPLLGVTSVTKAGWAFSESTALGGTGTAADFGITLEVGNELNWASDIASHQWTTGDSLTFFYESPLAPTTGLYYAQDDTNGEATSYVPSGTTVPIPGAASMGLLTLAGLAMMAVRRRIRMS